jgi:hypothetical protein
MKHVGEEDFLELYCGEATPATHAHMEACPECAARYAKFKQDLARIQPIANWKRSVDYGEHVWGTVRPKLIPYQKEAEPRSAWTLWRAGALAFGCALLLLAGFFGGRYWERVTATKANSAGNAQAARRVVLVVLTDHLDQSERLLVELEHADSSDGAENAQLQSEAQELLASNRLYRDTARNVGDPGVASALDQLQGVLAEVADGPTLTAADLDRMRKEMNIEGILFEIRVLRSRSSNQWNEPKTAKGASI